MTYEDAIKKIKQFGLYHAIGDLPNSVFTVQAFELAIEALEKQIPKKPKDYDSVPHHRCPNCNSAIRVYCDDPYDPVCKFCGQVIDWEK